jgi:hypothetical protein
MSFKVKVKDANSAFNKVKREIKRSGGTITGTVTKGEFQGAGVRGYFNKVGSNSFQITITDKPFFAPGSMVENKIRAFFA